MAFNNFEIIFHKIFFDSNPYEFLLYILIWKIILMTNILFMSF